MMWWGGDWGWLVGALLVVFCMVMMGRMMMGRSGHSHSGHGGSRPEARKILAERFARGEIREEEFEQRNRVLDRPAVAEREVRSGSSSAP